MKLWEAPCSHQLWHFSGGSCHRGNHLPPQVAETLKDINFTLDFLPVSLAFRPVQLLNAAVIAASRDAVALSNLDDSRSERASVKKRSSCFKFIGCQARAN
jgi:hypothetical protein